MGYIVLMLTNYFHDLAVALMAANIIIINLVEKYLVAEPDRAVILGRLVEKMSRITWLALAYVIVAGGVRAYFFMEFEWNPLVARNGMLLALALKHVLLVGLTIFGIRGQMQFKKRYPNNS